MVFPASGLVAWHKINIVEIKPVSLHIWLLGRARKEVPQSFCDNRWWVCTLPFVVVQTYKDLLSEHELIRMKMNHYWLEFCLSNKK